jgi:hypothetical protein
MLTSLPRGHVLTGIKVGSCQLARVLVAASADPDIFAGLRNSDDHKRFLRDARG